MRFSSFLLIVIVSLGITSCGRDSGKNISQGEIHYNISYLGNFAFPTKVLPKNLVVSFKENKILTEMTGVGKSGIINLANPELDIYDTYYSLFYFKKYYASKPGEQFPGFNAMEGMQIKETSKRAVFCGYDCKNAEVRIPGSDKVYEIWYTDEINVDEPNAATPFHEIDGVLLNFFFIMGDSELHFNCETVYSKEMPDDLFERRSDFERVSKEDIVKLMNRMLDTIGS